MSTRRLIRQTLTVARRDFIATVFTPIFLLFLFAPVIMLSFGAVGGLGAQSVASGSNERTRSRRSSETTTASSESGTAPPA